MLTRELIEIIKADGGECDYLELENYIINNIKENQYDNRFCVIPEILKEDIMLYISSKLHCSWNDVLTIYDIICDNNGDNNKMSFFLQEAMDFTDDLKRLEPYQM